MIVIDNETKKYARVAVDDLIGLTYICDKCKKEIKENAILTFFEDKDKIHLCKKCEDEFYKFIDKPMKDLADKLIMEFIK